MIKCALIFTAILVGGLYLFASPEANGTLLGIGYALLGGDHP